jgi:hypothetical protein
MWTTFQIPDLRTLSEKLFAKTSEYKKDDKKEWQTINNIISRYS